MTAALTLLAPPQAPANSVEAISSNDIQLSTGTFGHYALAVIRISKTNRKRFNMEKLQELAASIKTKGVAQPILIRPVTPTEADPQSYEIVAGERRFRASIIAGLQVIPAMCRTLSDMEALELQILENLQRDDPHPLEEAEGYERLMMKHGYNADQLADKLDKSRSYIYGRLKLCALNLEVREQFLDNQEKLPASTALLIARIPVPSLQTKAAMEILRPNGLPTDEPMSYRKAKQWVQDKYMLDLRKAIFMTDDSKLVKKAGNCNKCPKRAGNQPVVFEGVDANICTDPECFSEKTAAHYTKLVTQATKDGTLVFEGDDAREVWSTIYRRNSTHVGEDTPLYTFDRVTPGTGMAGYVKTYLKPDQRPPVVAYVKGSDGTVEPLYDRGATQLALEAAAICESEVVRKEREVTASAITTDSIQDQTDEEESRVSTYEEKRAIAQKLTEARAARYKELRAAVATAGGLSLTILREVTKLLLNTTALPDDLIGDVYPFEDRSDAGVCAYIDQAEFAQVQLILLDLAIGEHLTVEHYHIGDDEEQNFGEAALQAMENSEKVAANLEATAPPPAEEPQVAGAARPKLQLKSKPAAAEPETEGPIIKVKKVRTPLAPNAAWPFPTEHSIKRP
jgi:ParB/RepB/Spo0J family partition protein